MDCRNAVCAILDFPLVKKEINIEKKKEKKERKKNIWKKEVI